MDCPVDGTKLVMSERQGVEIDYCPDCRGVWLDRGELDKIIERAERDEPESRRDEPRRPEPSGHHPKKKRSFLTEMFEGFGEG